jgi:hypothetical protein
LDLAGALKKVEDANEGVNFDNKVKESICRSIYVRDEIKMVVWILLKEKIVWVVLGAGAFVVLELLKSLGLTLIAKIP